MNTQDSNGYVLLQQLHIMADMNFRLAEVVETKLWAALEDQDFDSLRIGPLLQE